MECVVWKRGAHSNGATHHGLASLRGNYDKGEKCNKASHRVENCWIFLNSSTQAERNVAVVILCLVTNSCCLGENAQQLVRGHTGRK